MHLFIMDTPILFIQNNLLLETVLIVWLKQSFYYDILCCHDDVAFLMKEEPAQLLISIVQDQL